MASRQAVLPANGARLSVQGIGSGVFDNKRYRGLDELMIRVYLHCEDRVYNTETCGDHS